MSWCAAKCTRYPSSELASGVHITFDIPMNDSYSRSIFITVTTVGCIPSFDSVPGTPRSHNSNSFFVITMRYLPPGTIERATIVVWNSYDRLVKAVMGVALTDSGVDGHKERRNGPIHARWRAGKDMEVTGYVGGNIEAFRTRPLRIDSQRCRILTNALYVLQVCNH